MTSIDETKIYADGIGHVLDDNRLVVPPYQRSYSWDQVNVEQYLIDITSAFDEGASEYFLGSIVLVKNDHGRLEIVDGQQRLATTSILLAVIKDYFTTRGEVDRAETIKHDYLFSKNVLTMAKEQHLSLNLIDNDSFGVITENSRLKIADASAKSVKNLLATTELTWKYIRAIETTSADPVEKLARLVAYIRSNVKVIAVLVPDDANAFAIFETLNDRGLPLSIADLLKNYLFGKAGEDIEKAKSLWNTLISTLNTVGDETQLPSFIRHYWASSNAHVTEKELFRTIKAKVHTSSEAIGLITKLVEAAKSYVSLLNPEHERWTRLGPDAKEAIRVLNDLKFEQTRPLLLAITMRFSDNEVKKSLKKIVAWSVRLLIAGNTRTGQFSKDVSAISIKVNSKDIKDTKSLSSAVAGLVPEKDNFISAFASFSPSRQLARYYLAQLEKKMREKNGEEPGLSPALSTDEVNLEHILPLSSDEKVWANFSEESARENYGRLGNLTLMNAPRNSGIGNAGFDEKKKVYAKSTFMTTRMVVDYDAWSEKEVAARQQELAKFANSIWQK